jgi:exodeoxyribonuclease VII small subunit
MSTSGGPAGPPSAPPIPERPPERAGELPFEDALQRLEAIVDRLECGELALEDALAVFAEGVGLSRQLSQRLGDAERQIEQLVREGAGVVAKPLVEEPG